MQTVTFLLFPHIMASSISLPLEMLNAADNIRRSSERNKSSLRIQIASSRLDKVMTSSGFYILPDTLLEDVKPSDLLLVPGLWRNPFTTLQQQLSLCTWLKDNAKHHRNICAVGTGSTFLAEAGLLDNKPATTHWFYFDMMEKRYPNVQWKRQHLITQSKQLHCAGSINAVADLTIHFIEQGFSPSIARRVESQFSPEVRRTYDMHSYETFSANLHSDEVVAAAQSHIQQHFDQPIDYLQLAAQLNISLRTLQRRFNQATNFTPLQYQQHIRIANARDLLQNTNLSIQEIAETIGYSDAAHFAALFKRITEQAPHSWREAVRGKLFKV